MTNKMQRTKYSFKAKSSFGLLFSGVILFNITWLALSLLLQNKALPSPIDVYKAMPKISSEGMIHHSIASFERVVWGTSISLIIALIVGTITGLNKKASTIINPLLYLSYPIPKLALLPIIMITFGIGEATKVIMIILIIVFQLIISVRDSIRNINKENFHVLTSLRATKMQYIQHVVFPGILPDILSALRVTIGIATSVLFVTETFGTDKGLGFFIVDAWMRIDYISMYAGIVMISVIGFILFLIIDIVDAIFCKWNKIRTGN